MIERPAIATAHQVGRELCEALGLNAGLVTEIDLHMAVNEAISVTVKQFATREQADRIAKILTRYELKKKEQEEVGVLSHGPGKDELENTALANPAKNFVMGTKDFPR